MGNYSIFFAILQLLFWPIIIIGLIIFFVARHSRSKGNAMSQDKDWYLQLSLSKEDGVSQFLFLLSFCFLGITLLAFNRDLGDPLSWRTILLLTSLIGLLGAYYFKTIYTLTFSIIGITSWWGAQAWEWIKLNEIKTSALLVGLCLLALLFYSLGHLHEKEIKFKRFALVYLILGIIEITGVLFFFSTKLGLYALVAITKGADFFNSWPLVISLFLFALVIIGAIFYAAKKKLIFIPEIIAVVILLTLFSVIALLPPQELFIKSTQNYGLFVTNDVLSTAGFSWAIFFNLIIFFELLGLIFSGYLRREKWLINLGSFFVFILIIVKYFDWFFTSMDKSIFFIGAGILLFAIGWFMEKGRRYIIKNIKIER